MLTGVQALSKEEVIKLIESTYSEVEQSEDIAVIATIGEKTQIVFSRELKIN